MRVLICGCRNWDDRNAIEREIKRLYQVASDRGEHLIVIEGGCRGADTMARRIARRLNIAVREYPADWGQYGRSAGPIRNQHMLNEGKPELVLAFHPDIKRSKGTADMIRRASKAGIPCQLFTR